MGIDFLATETQQSKTYYNTRPEPSQHQPLLQGGCESNRKPYKLTAKQIRLLESLGAKVITK